MLSAGTLFMSQMAIYLVLQLSLPAVIAATSLGLIVAMFQSVVQLQEQTLGFAVKLVSIVVILFVTGPWISKQLLNFLYQIFDRLENMQ